MRTEVWTIALFHEVIELLLYVSWAAHIFIFVFRWDGDTNVHVEFEKDPELMIIL